MTTGLPCDQCGAEMVPCFSAQNPSGQMKCTYWWCTACDYTVKAKGRERQYRPRHFDKGRK